MERQFDYLHTPENLKIRYGVWHTRNNPPRGSVLYLSGRAEFIEKNAETIDRLLLHGFDAYTFDWRGQGMSSRLLNNPHKGYVGSYDDYLSDLDLFMAQIYLPQARSRKICLAHSMGAHVVARYMHDHGGVFEKCVMVAPMFDINTCPVPYGLARRGVDRAVRWGLSKSFVIGNGDYRPEKKRFFFNPLTGDPDRFADEIKKIRKNPELAVGGVTYGWLAASFASIDIVQSAGYVEAIHTPVLVVSGRRDRVVDRRAQRRICRKMPNCRLIDLSGARHEILKETDKIQNLFWNSFDRFVSA